MIRSHQNRQKEVRENMRGGSGKVTIEHLFSKDEFKANVRLCARLVLEPGASIGSHSHDTEDEVYIVEKGVGMLDDGATKKPVTAGDAVLTGNGESHAIANTGEEDLVITAMIMCY